MDRHSIHCRLVIHFAVKVRGEIAGRSKVCGSLRVDRISHGCGSSFDGLDGQGAAYVDEVVTDDGEANPPLHPTVSRVATTIQAVAPLQHTDSAFTAGPPFLPFLEPAGLL